MHEQLVSHEQLGTAVRNYGWQSNVTIELDLDFEEKVNISQTNGG